VFALLTPDLAAWIRVRSLLTDYIHELRMNNMHTFVYPTRRDILKTAYERYLEGRSSQSDLVGPMPGWRFLTTLKVFDDIIKAPPQVPFRDDMFSRALAKIPKILPQILPPLRMNVELKLSALCLSPASSTISGGDHDFVLQRLRLASSFFLCESDLLAYPEVLHHAFSVLHTSSVLDDTSLPKTDCWNIGFTFPIPRYQGAAVVVILCGLDPTIATPDDMEAQNVLLRCSLCRATHTHAMTWRSAVCHVDYHLVSPNF